MAFHPLKGLGHALTVVGSWQVVSALKGALTEKGVEKGTEIVTERLRKRFEEHRDEMWSHVLITLAHDRDPVASENLKRRQRERNRHGVRTYGDTKPYEYGDEDYMVKTLSDLWESLGEEHEYELRLDVFEYLGMMDDEHFDDTLDAFNNDGLKQYFIKSLLLVHRAGTEVHQLLVTSGTLKRLAGHDEEWEPSLVELSFELAVRGKSEFRQKFAQLRERDRETAERIRNWRTSRWWLKGAS
jgi:hypothetical protein